MKIFYISDHHFNHFNIIRYCNRPFSTVEEMNETMIKNWNSVVTNDDMVIHGGDFALGSKKWKTYKVITREIFERLNGYKILIKGNHDRSKVKMLEIGFKAVVDFWYDNGILVVHTPWDLAIEYKLLYDECKIALYGHTHDRPVNKPQFTKIRSMCVELNNYTPFTLET